MVLYARHAGSPTPKVKILSSRSWASDYRGQLPRAITEFCDLMPVLRPGRAAY